MPRFEPPRALEDIPTVSEMIAAADVTVAGLEKAKQIIAWALRRHMVAGFHQTGVRVPNMLILGPTGGGKTHLLLSMIRACPVVWEEINATEYSDVGYIGRDLTTMYAPLVAAKWSGNHKAGEEAWTQREMILHAQRYGVLLVDEFDKLRMVNRPGERQVGRALQAELLKLVEGTDIEVKRYEGDRGFSFSTHGILHVAMGAFEGLDRVQALIDGIENPTPSDLVNLHMDVDGFDLAAYGFLGELIGRFNVMVPLPKLDAVAITRILTEQTIPRYTTEFKLHGLTLEVDDGAIAWLAGEVARKGPSGARSITPLMEEVTGDAAKAGPGWTVAVTAHSVMHRGCELREPSRKVL